MGAFMELKMVVAVRNDLKMGRGKLAAQVGHACVTCSVKAIKIKPDLFWEWYNESQKKVVVKVDNLEQLQQLLRIANSNGLITALITDAGHTQLEPGTVTCLGIGPAPADDVDRITGNLKLI